MKVSSIFLILIFASTIFLIGCSENETEETIKIGAIAPLTGDFSTLGERIRDGMELAREELIEEGKDVVVIYEDACLGKETTTVIKKLVEIDKISMLGASFCLVGLVPIIPYLEENKVVGFNTAANPDVTLNHNYIFSTNKAIKDDSERLASYAVNNLNASTASIVYYVTPLGEDYNKYLAKHFENYGGEIISSHQTELSATDFRTELSKIKESNVDVIFIVHLAGSLGNFIKQTRELGIDATILGNSEAEDPNVLSVAGNAAEGFTISSAEPPEKADYMKEFQKKFEDKFGTKADVLAANAYDSLKLQVMAHEKCNGEVECIVNELHSVVDYPGVSGKITIQEDGSSLKPNVFKIVKDGEFVIIEN